MFKYFTLAALSSIILADDDNTENNQKRENPLQVAVQKKFQWLNMINPQVTQSDGEEELRALTQSDMGLLSDYGCWCFFESAHGKGKGKPIDEIDGFCKTLHDGYECILHDAAQAGIDCIPWEIPYNSAFGSGFPTGLTMEGLSQECNNQNTADTCEAWTCKVEGWFVQQYFLYSTAGGVINAAYRHENGFDQDVSCPVSVGVESEKSCCGSYPLRFPFKTYDGARDCCQTHTYNTNLFQCCPDGHIKMTC